MLVLARYCLNSPAPSSCHFSTVTWKYGDVYEDKSGENYNHYCKFTSELMP